MDLDELIKRYDLVETAIRSRNREKMREHDLDDFFEWVQENKENILGWQPEDNLNGLKLLFIQDILEGELDNLDHGNIAYKFIKKHISDTNDLTALEWALSKFTFSHEHVNEFTTIALDRLSSQLTPNTLYQSLYIANISSNYLKSKEEWTPPFELFDKFEIVFDNIETFIDENNTISKVKEILSLLFHIIQNALRTVITPRMMQSLEKKESVPEYTLKTLQFYGYPVFTLQEILKLLEKTLEFRKFVYKLNNMVMDSNDEFLELNHFLFSIIIDLHKQEQKAIHVLFKENAALHIDREDFDQALAWNDLKLRTLHSRSYEHQVREYRFAIDLASKSSKSKRHLRLYAELIGYQAMSLHIDLAIEIWLEMKGKVKTLDLNDQENLRSNSKLIDSFVDITSMALKYDKMPLVEPILDDFLHIVEEGTQIPTGVLKPLKEWSEKHDKPELTQRIDNILHRV